MLPENTTASRPPVFVKICGTTSLADAQLSLAAGANALGFIFAPSKRRVTAEQVAEITRSLPNEVLTVGVFTSGSAAEILEVVQHAGLRAVQLHMPHDPERIAALHAAGALLIQVIPVEADPDRLRTDPALREQLLQALTTAFGDRRLWAVLLDASLAGASGGLGTQFGWQEVGPLLQKARQATSLTTEQQPRFLLAGGLRPENIVEALESLAPVGVDVVSGVEAEPGRKDPARLHLFLQRAREARLPKTR